MEKRPERENPGNPADDLVAASPKAVTREIVDFIKGSSPSPQKQAAALEAATMPLRETLGRFQQLILPDYFKRLYDAEIVVDGEFQIFAHAEHANNRIVVSKGYLDVIRYRIEVSVLLGVIRNRFDELTRKLGITHDDLNTLAKKRHRIINTLFYQANPAT